MKNACSTVAFVPIALEGVVHAAAGELLHLNDGIAEGGVDTIRGADLACQRELRRLRVDRHDLACSRQPRTLDDGDPHSTASDHRDGRARTHASGVQRRAESRRDATGEDRRAVERVVRIDLHQRVLVDEHQLGEAPEMDVLVDACAVEGDPRRCAGRPGTQVTLADRRSATHAELALPTGRVAARRHMVARSEVSDIFADGFHDSGCLVAEHDRAQRWSSRCRARAEWSVDVVEIAVTQSRADRSDQNLASRWLVDAELGDLEPSGNLVEQRGLHRITLQRGAGVVEPTARGPYTDSVT